VRYPDSVGFRYLLVFVGLTVLSSLASSAAARVWLLAYPVLALGIGLWLLLSPRYCSYLAFAIGLWLLSPEVRRIIDWKTTYHDLSPVSLAAPVVSLIA